MTREEAIAELVSNYSDLVTAFKDKELQDFASPEVIQAMAVSAFIQVHGKHSNGSPAPASISPDGWIKGKVTDKKVTKTAKGTDRFQLTVNGVNYSTFKKEVFAGNVFNIGDEVEMKVQQDEKGYWNIQQVKGAEIPF